MASAIFEVCRMLDATKLHYFIERDSGTDTILLTVSIPGERIEIDVFEDDNIEISRFRGDEGIEGGMELLREIVRRETEAG
jgi:hypothetical protein